MPRPSHRGLLLAAAVSLAAYVALALIDRGNGTLRAEHVVGSAGWYIVAFVGFGIAVFANERNEFDRRWLWALPVVFRLLMLTTEPTLSDDVYRYLWDGHLVAEGVNPYSFAINASELDPFEISARRLANNETLSSPYLPAAHGLFGLSAALLPSDPLTMQLVMTLFDLASAAIVVRLLALAELPSRRVLLYLWNPLIIIETAHAAHLDAFMIFLVLAALLAGLSKPARSTSPVLLALAVLTRPIPGLLTPVLWWRWGWRGRIAFAVTGMALVVPFGFGPSGFGLSGESSGTGVFGSARVYGQEFRFNAVVATWLEDLTGATVARVVTAAVMGGVLLITLRRAKAADSARDLLRLGTLPLMAYVLLTPVLHPWYLSVLLVMLVFVAPGDREGGDRWLLLVPWAFLAAASPLSYLTYRDPEAFGELDWVRAAQWYPTIVLLVFTSFWVFFAVQAEPAVPEGSVGDEERFERRDHDAIGKR